MSREIQSIMFTLIFVLALVSGQPLAYAQGRRGLDPIVPNHPDFPLRVLPLGASITWGQESSDGNGYREHLRELLLQRSTQVNMVGTVHSGDMPDDNNEGHPGARVDQVAVWAEQDLHFQPNLILINAGTNDVLQKARKYPVDKIGERMDNLIGHLFDRIPGVTVVLSTLLITNHTNANKLIRETVNPQYKALFKDRQEKKQRIVLADLYPALKLEDLADGIHPTDEGYEKLAEVWLKAIYEAGKNGLLMEPRPVDSPDINVLPDLGPSTTKAREPIPLFKTSTMTPNITSMGISGRSMVSRTTTGRTKDATTYTIPAKAPTHSGPALPSKTSETNMARSNKATWFEWWF